MEEWKQNHYGIKYIYRDVKQKKNFLRKGEQILMRSTFKTNEELPATLSATDISKYLEFQKLIHIN